MHTSRAVAGLAAAAAIAAGLALAPAASAQAASGCWDAGFKKPDEFGVKHEAYYCYNVPGTKVQVSFTSTSAAGYLNTGTNWFVCRYDDGPYIGGPHPYRWEYTEADNGKWGWVRDTAISSETNPLHTCS